MKTSFQHTISTRQTIYIINYDQEKLVTTLCSKTTNLHVLNNKLKHLKFSGKSSTKIKKKDRKKNSILSIIK